MNIFLISNMYPSNQSPYFGVFVKTFVDNLRNSDVNITRTALIRGLEANKPAKIYKYFKFFFDVFRGLLQSNYDVIYVHYAAHSLLPLLPFYFILDKKKLVVNAHGDDIYYNTWIGKIVKPIIKKSKLLVVPSRYYKQLAHKKGLNKNVVVSYSGGIKTNRFNIENKAPSDDFIRLGYVSRIVGDKGWKLLLNACKNLKGTRQRIKLDIIGSGEESERLKEQLENNVYPIEINYLGPVENHSVPNHLKQFDLFVFPSSRESLGIAALEALSCGVPVLASAIPPITEYITDGYNGFLFELHSEKGLAANIQKFINLPADEKEALQRNAYQSSLAFRSDQVTKDLLFHLSKIHK